MQFRLTRFTRYSPFLMGFMSSPLLDGHRVYSIGFVLFSFSWVV